MYKTAIIMTIATTAFADLGGVPTEYYHSEIVLKLVRGKFNYKLFHFFSVCCTEVKSDSELSRALRLTAHLFLD